MARIPNFYVDQFGFTSAPWGNDRTAIYLCQRDQGRGAAWAYVGVDDAKRACDEFVQTGIAMRRPPQNYTWAFGTHIEDPDGNVLRIGSDPLADQPFSDQPLGN